MSTRNTVMDELYDEFGNDYIEGMSLYLHNAAENFIEKRGLADLVFLDEDLLEQCLTDILFDIARLRKFHGIEQENRIKLYSYTCSWWLRRKPFQRIANIGSAAMFVNELFAANFLLSALPRSLSETSVFDQLKASAIPGHLLYHMKYRNTNPQSLELFLVGLDAVK